MNDRAEVQDIKLRLNDRIREVCAWLLPDGRRAGNHWICNHPHKDRPGQTEEMRVYLTGVVGSWKDFRSGDKGDVLGLVQMVKGTDFAGAMRHARDFLGIARLSPEERRQGQARAQQRIDRENAAAKRKEDRKRKEAEKLFLSGALYGSGTPADIHARRFDIETRGIDLDGIETLDKTTFRYLPDCEYWPLAVWEKDVRGFYRKTKEGPRFPAILSAMRWVTGVFADHHVTFLDPAIPDKATLPLSAKGHKRSPRLMKCPNKGAVMWISHGPEGLPPPQSCRPFPLILAEGRETGLHLARGIPEARVWACGSISGIQAAPVNFPFVSEIYVAGENDWDKPQAQKQLDLALAELETSGKPLELMLSHLGSDFADLGKGI